MKLKAVDKIRDRELLENIKNECKDKEIANLANQKINRMVLAEAEASSTDNIE